MFSRKFFYILVAVVGLALFAVACGGQKGGEPVTTVTPSPTVEMPSPTPTPSPTPSPTPEPIVTPEPTPEPPSANPVPGSCLVFEEKYCGLGRRVEFGGYGFLAFRLPEGAVVFTPFGGKINTSGTSLINTKAQVISICLDRGEISVADSEDICFEIHGDFRVAAVQRSGSEAVNVDDVYFIYGGEVQAGQIIALVADQGITLMGDYNVVLSFNRYSPEKHMFVPEDDLMRQFFPYW